MAIPVRAITTPSELADFYEDLLDDAPDRDQTYALLSQAKNRINMENQLKVLQVEDTSFVAAIGDTYLNTHALPDKWSKTVYMRIGTGQSALRLFPTSFEKRTAQQGNRFFIDLRNKLFGFTGTLGRSGTIYHGYIETTDDFTNANEDTLLTTLLPWPSEFFPIIAYEAAGFFQTGIDTDSISASQGGVNLARAQSLMDAFIGWDHDMKLEDMGGRGGYADDADNADQPFDVGLL